MIFSLVCIENSRFIMKRHWRSDFSVDYSQYLHMNVSKYEEYIPLQDLKYTGVQVLAENHTNPNPLIFSWIRKPQHHEALSSSLGKVENIDYTRKINYYVIYAAIDLMNYHYSALDTTGKTVSAICTCCDV